MDFQFSINETEANLVLKGLGELPAKESISLINKIQMQAAPQLKAAVEAAQAIEKAAQDNGADPLGKVRDFKLPKTAAEHSHPNESDAGGEHPLGGAA